MVIVENYPVERQLAAAGEAARLQIEGLEAHDRTHYSFAITVVPGDALTIGFQFDASRHDRAQVERTAGHYLRVLRAFSTAAQLAVAHQLEVSELRGRGESAQHLQVVAGRPRDLIAIVTSGVELEVDGERRQGPR